MSAPASSRRPTVLLPRPVGRGEELSDRLHALGYSVDHHPFVELVLEHDADMAEAVEDLAAGRFTHLVVTSPRTVDALSWFDGGADTGTSVMFAVPQGTEVWAVGETTAQALQARGVQPTMVAAGSGKALVQEAPPAPEGARVLLPASSAAAPTVPEGLRAKGYTVQQEVAYRPRTCEIDPEVVLGLRRGDYAAIVLTSSMIATLAGHFAVHESIKVVTIGAPTTAAAEAANLHVHAQSDKPSDAALAEAVHALLKEPS